MDLEVGDWRNYPPDEVIFNLHTNESVRREFASNV